MNKPNFNTLQIGPYTFGVEWFWDESGKVPSSSADFAKLLIRINGAIPEQHQADALHYQAIMMCLAAYDISLVHFESDDPDVLSDEDEMAELEWDLAASINQLSVAMLTFKRQNRAVYDWMVNVIAPEPAHA